MLHPRNGNESLLLYHVAPGKLPIRTFRSRNQQFVTMYRNKKIRVNKYAYGVRHFPNIVDDSSGD